MYEEHLIGFDGRYAPSAQPRVWTEHGRNLFLITSDVNHPLSVDIRVWQSVFSNEQFIKLPPVKQWFQGIWADLEALQRHSASVQTTPWFIALTQVLSKQDAEATGVAHFQIEPASLDANWPLLGYDVAEDVLLSGLMNMGYEPDEKAIAHSRFAAHLNEHHLFTSIEAAQAFATWCNDRDAGHGPFFPYGIYLIKR